MRVFFSAGEASGDAYAAALAPHFRQALPSAELIGIGGSKSRAESIRQVVDSSHWGAMGVIQSLMKVPTVWLGLQKAKRELHSGPPGLLVPIDFGYFNVRLCRAAKAAGWKVLYFIPPGSWRRDKQGADLPSLTDEIVTPFPWSAELLNKAGGRAHFFGHPLAEMIGDLPESSDRSGVAILPGSRMHEIDEHLRVIAPVMEGLDMPIRFGVAQTVTPSEMEASWKRFGGPPAEFTHDTHTILKASRCGIVCSGTATLEAALCGLPIITIYRGTKMMRFEYALRKPKFFAISLPNILLQKMVVPELIGEAVEPQAIDALLENLMDDDEMRRTQLEAFEEIQKSLLGAQVFEKTAALAQKMMAEA